MDVTINKDLATGRVYFKAVSMKDIAESAALMAQAERGYHLADHSFRDFEVKMCPVLHRYTATWFCFTNREENK